MRKKISSIMIAIFLLTVVFVDSFTIIPETNVFADSNEESVTTHEINLYIFGEGGGSQTFPHFHGNITTKKPDSQTDEYQALYPKTAGAPGGNDIFWWHSEPLHSNITINEDVFFTIWAICNSERNISFTLFFGISAPDEGAYAYGSFAEGNITSSEPVEFKSIMPKETLEENDLINYTIGDSITFGIQAWYRQPQLPSEVRVLYNSTAHPSHMKINTNSISVNLLNSTTSGDTANVEMEIVDAFGIEDIKEYEIEIFNPKDKEIDSINKSESLLPQEGKFYLDLIWSDSNSISGEYTVVTSVTDNNNNQWELINKFDLQFPGDETDDKTSGDNSLSFLLLIIGIVILFIILGFIIARRKRKDQSREFP